MVTVMHYYGDESCILGQSCRAPKATRSWGAYVALLDKKKSCGLDTYDVTNTDMDMYTRAVHYTIQNQPQSSTYGLAIILQEVLCYNLIRVCDRWLTPQCYSIAFNRRIMYMLQKNYRELIMATYEAFVRYLYFLYSKTCEGFWL